MRELNIRRNGEKLILRNYVDRRRMGFIDLDTSDYGGGHSGVGDDGVGVGDLGMPGDFMFRQQSVEQGMLSNNFGLQGDMFDYKDFVQK